MIFIKEIEFFGKFFLYSERGFKLNAVQFLGKSTKYIRNKTMQLQKKYNCLTTFEHYY